MNALVGFLLAALTLLDRQGTQSFTVPITGNRSKMFLRCGYADCSLRKDFLSQRDCFQTHGNTSISLSVFQTLKRLSDSVNSINSLDLFDCLHSADS